MESKFLRHLPHFYGELREAQILADITDEKMNEYFEEIQRGLNNTFVILADEEGIEGFEHILRIKAFPATESLEFRRERVLNRLQFRVPLTMPWLRNRLDVMLGAGKYTATVDYAERQLTIETTSNGAGWFHELSVTIATVKPANMTYLYKPRTNQKILMNETIYGLASKYNYRLATKWELGKLPFRSMSIKYLYELGLWGVGENPFADLSVLEVFKMAEISSLRPKLLHKTAEYVASQIHTILLNNKVRIESFEVLGADGSDVNIQYAVDTNMGIDVVNSVKILDSEGEELASAQVYVPMISDAIFIHVISIGEGVTEEPVDE